MLLPVLALTFLLGWCMCWIGSKKGSAKAQQATKKEECVTFMPIVLEEDNAINY